MKGKLLYAVYDDVARVWKSFPSLSEAVDWRRKKAPHASRILINVRHVGKEYNYSAGSLLFETNHLEEQTNDNRKDNRKDNQNDNQKNNA